MDRSDIAERMKSYEKISSRFLTKRIPVIIRVDGKSFHTLTRKRFGKKWSPTFTNMMAKIAFEVSNEIQGCKFAYCQSDEISFLLTDYRTINTDGWFDYNINKLVSVSAALASAVISNTYSENICFDSRAFSIPQDEVCNYFIWRQQDATRNAIQMAGREVFSHKQLFKHSCNEIQELLFQKGINFNNFPTDRKRGFCIVDGVDERNIPIFTQEREYIERFVFVRED